jgi:hypothetical protein
MVTDLHMDTRPGSGSFCIEGQRTVSSMEFEVARTRSGGSGRTGAGVEQVVKLRMPSLVNDLARVGVDMGSARTNRDSRAAMDKSNVVANSLIVGSPGIRLAVAGQRASGVSVRTVTDGSSVSSPVGLLGGEVQFWPEELRALERAVMQRIAGVLEIKSLDQYQREHQRFLEWWKQGAGAQLSCEIVCGACGTDMGSGTSAQSIDNGQTCTGVMVTTIAEGAVFGLAECVFGEIGEEGGK